MTFYCDHAYPVTQHLLSPSMKQMVERQAHRTKQLPVHSVELKFLKPRLHLHSCTRVAPGNVSWFSSGQTVHVATSPDPVWFLYVPDGQAVERQAPREVTQRGLRVIRTADFQDSCHNG